MIREFNNKEQSDLMKLIQDLRDSGVSKHINLPQLVVVGDQSSGKSSVLQAIAGIPFPQNSGQCTKFATEVILRPAKEESHSVTIRPYDSDEIRLVRCKIISFEDLINTIRQPTAS